MGETMQRMFVFKMVHYKYPVVLKWKDMINIFIMNIQNE
jgi:hypothetical protein